MTNKVTWRQLLEEAIGDDERILGTTLTDEEYDKEFDAGFGGSEGCPFTLWTDRRVYFPDTYDGSEWAASVPRNTCDEATDHVGGG